MQQSEEQDFDFITFGYLLHNQPQSTIMAQTHLIIYFLFFSLTILMGKREE